MTKLFSLALIAVVGYSGSVFSQVKYHSATSNIEVSGTSTLHDWKEKSAGGTAEAVFVFNNDKLTGLSSLTFSIAAKSLKSEHTLMDNNTYKALKADKNPTITYQQASANITAQDATTFIIKSVGKLTIAGTTKETEVVATARVNSDKSITVTGNRKMKMTDFSVTPPTVMFGSIKTGNDIVISFNLKLVR